MQFNNSFRDVVRKFFGSLFLPMLFISKAIEEFVYWQFVDGSAKPVIAMAILGAVTLALWLVIDDVADVVE